MNFSIDYLNMTTSYGEITKGCFDWCKEQHFTNDFGFLWIIFAAFVGLLLFRLMILNSKQIMDTLELDEDTLQRYVMNVLDFSIIVLTVFFIWFKFIR